VVEHWGPPLPCFPRRPPLPPLRWAGMERGVGAAQRRRRRRRRSLSWTTLPPQLLLLLLPQQPLVMLALVPPLSWSPPHLKSLAPPSTTLLLPMPGCPLHPPKLPQSLTNSCSLHPLPHPPLLPFPLLLLPLTCSSSSSSSSRVVAPRWMTCMTMMPPFMAGNGRQSTAPPSPLPPHPHRHLLRQHG